MAPVRAILPGIFFPTRFKESRYVEGAASLLFAVVIIVLYRHVLNSYWLYDDPYLLRNALSHSAWSFFVTPGIWQKVSVGNLTPWVMVSYKIDYWLFGLNQHFFYLHQLLSLWLVSIALYKLLRLWNEPFFAACGSIFFLASAPAAASAEMLMTRHYIEGLFFCLVSFYFFVRSVREESFLYSLLAAAVYFLSMTAKELYVPLAVVLFFLPEGRFRERIVRVAPLVAAMALYFVWRHYMLGGFIAGPSRGGLFGSYRSLSSTVLLLKNMYGTIIMMTGVSPLSKLITPFLGPVILIPVVLSVFILLRKKKYSWLIFHISLLGAVYSVPFSVINPYYAAADFTQYRIVFLIAAYISAISVLCLEFLYRNSSLWETYAESLAGRALKVVLPLSIAAVIFAGSLVWIRTEGYVTLRPLATEGKFFMSAGNNFLLVKSSPVWAGTYYYQDLETFRKERTGESSPLVVYGPFAFLGYSTPPRLRGIKVVTYDASRGAMSEITSSYLRERGQFLSSLRTLSLTVRLKVDHGVLRYSLGPKKSGNYFILLGYKPEIYCMKVAAGRIGTLSLATSLRVYARVGWQSPQGWVTVSPEWFLDFSRNRDIAWSR